MEQLRRQIIEQMEEQVMSVTSAGKTISLDPLILGLSIL